MSSAADPGAYVCTREQVLNICQPGEIITTAQAYQRLGLPITPGGACYVHKKLELAGYRRGRYVVDGLVTWGWKAPDPEQAPEAAPAPTALSEGSADGACKADQRTIAALRKRLDRWELEHLRRLAAELAERLEAAEQRCEDLQERVYRAEDAADMWRQDAERLADDLRAIGSDVGLTAAGELVTIGGQEGGAA